MWSLNSKFRCNAERYRREGATGLNAHVDLQSPDNQQLAASPITPADHRVGTEPQPGFFREIRKYFVLPNEPGLARFLSAHSPLAALLLDSAAHLKACFGADTVFHLKAPIDGLGEQTMYAVAIWPGSARSAMDALDQFDSKWWIANASRADGYLTFTYELV